MELKKVDEDTYFDDFWYDLTDGGYLKPEDVLINKEDVVRVNEAIKVIKEFQESLEEAGML